jgi:hypothetical protein
MTFVIQYPVPFEVLAVVGRLSGVRRLSGFAQRVIGHLIANGQTWSNFLSHQLLANSPQLIDFSSLTHYRIRRWLSIYKKVLPVSPVYRAPLRHFKMHPPAPQVHTWSRRVAKRWRRVSLAAE